MFVRLALLGALFAVAVTMAMLSVDQPGFAPGFRVSSAAAEEEKVIELQDDVLVRYIGTFETKPQSGDAEGIVAFAFKDPTMLQQHEKVISASDQIFSRFVIVPAEKNKLKRAGVFFLISETKEGDPTIQKYEDFHYARGSNGVWLREAGDEPWKVAQDPNWTAPESEKLELAGFGTVDLDFVGPIFGPAGSKAFGIEMRTDTPVDNDKRKYAEIRAVWLRLDREKLKAEGFDYVAIENFTDKRIGRFQVRMRYYLNIRRPAGGDWPDVPETPPADPNAPLTASLDPRLPVNVANLIRSEAQGPTMVTVSLPQSSAVSAGQRGVGFTIDALGRVPPRAYLH